MRLDLPKSALVTVNQLVSDALKHNNASMQVKAAIYRVALQTRLGDDEQASSVETLRGSIAQSAYPVKPNLQSLLAQLYWKHYQANRYRISKRSKLEHADADFLTCDIQTLIDETVQLYEVSMKDAEREQNTLLGFLADNLQGDSSTLYLRPALFDKRC